MPIGAPAPSPLDGNQVLQHAFIDTTGELRVNATISPAGGATEVLISHTNDSIRLGDGSTLVTGTLIGSDFGIDVNVLNADFDVRDLSATQDNVAISDGTNQVSVTATNDLQVEETTRTAGIATTLTIPAGNTIELKVGGSVKSNRVLIKMQAKDKNITYGPTVGTAGLTDAFRNQLIVLPFGPNTPVHIKNNAGVSGDIVIWEV